MGPKLETPRLRLRPIAGRHLSGILEIWTHPEVRRHLWDDHIVGEERVGVEIARSRESFRSLGRGQWVVRRREKRRTIGSCGLLRIRGSDAIELVYCIEPSLWNNGFATEAATAVVGYAFRTLRLPVLYGRCAADNAASLRVLEKVGMHAGIPHPDPDCQGTHLAITIDEFSSSPEC
jgi:RimJ/RimL family protein N-acetyltransferase